MKKSDLLFLFSSFIIWRITLFVFLVLAVKFLPLQRDFLGGGMQNYLQNPGLWGWLNFDGEHYLAIAQNGYQPLTYFFFPIFPILSKYLANFIGQGQTGLAISGLIVSNLSFLVGLIGLWKLVEIDFDRKIAKYSVLLLLFFPTSFYFGSFYTESLYFALTVWSFYFIRKDKWIHGGIIGGVATAARIIGIALIPAYIAEFWVNKKKNLWKFIGICLVPIGILIYMYYLKEKTGDPLNFINTVSIYGAQRSSQLILLPQVFYRYIVKIIPFVNYNYFPNVFVSYLEIISSVLFLVLSVISFKKLRLSYAIYLAIGYLIPTLSGSFSSLPRYVLILFPGFILMAIYVSKISKHWRIPIFSVLFVGLAIATGFFLRGYWVS